MKYVVLGQEEGGLTILGTEDELEKAIQRAKDLSISWPGQQFVVYVALRCVEATVKVEVKDA